MKKRIGEAAPAANKPIAQWTKLASTVEAHARLIAILLVLVGTLRIVSTYPVFSYTFDEPAHIACGMEWLDQGTYQLEPQHPPLARIMTALLPRLAGARSAGIQDLNSEGLAVLSQKGLDRTLALSRAGTLPFFWITCWVAFLFTRWIAGSPVAAVLVVFLVTMTPGILAHAGLATTDMGLTAMFLLAIYTGWRWIEEPTLCRAACFGAALAGAILVKFSTFPFFATVALFALAGRWCAERPTLKQTGKCTVQLAVAIGIASLIVWAGYRFSLGPAPYVGFPVPAPELLKGIKQVQDHNATGHLSYLLGTSDTKGWWMFYIVALGVKTPLPMLVLGIFGLMLMCSPRAFGVRAWIIPSIVLGILGFSSLFSKIQIGTRHVLPVEVALAIAGACAALWMVRRYSRAPAILAAALLLIAGSSFAAHPDYLSYFNLLAGDKPENILVDSDLDWGQDMKRLGNRLREVGAKEVYFNQMEPGDLTVLYGFPPIRPLDVNGPQPGWNAVSLTPLKFGIFKNARYVYDHRVAFWPEQIQPTERISKGVLLFYRP